MSKQMTVAIAGLGSRGRDTYAKAAKIYPDKMKIVAIADIDPEKVKLTAEEYDVPMSHCYESAEDMLKEERKGIICFLKNQFHRIWVNAEKYPKWQKNVKEKWLSVMF